MGSTRMFRTATALAVIALFSGCATWSGMEPSEKGTAVGATGGALVGAAVGGPVGAAIGAGVGGYAGHHQASETAPAATTRPVSDSTSGTVASPAASVASDSRRGDANVHGTADRSAGMRDADVARSDATMARTNDAMMGSAFADAHDAQTIRSLQLSLRERGFDPGPIDGVWGPRTESALRRFQESQGLSGVGQLDAQTMSALELGAARPSANAAVSARDAASTAAPGAAGSPPR